MAPPHLCSGHARRTSAQGIRAAHPVRPSGRPALQRLADSGRLSDSEFDRLSAVRDPPRHAVRRPGQIATEGGRVGRAPEFGVSGLGGTVKRRTGDKST